LKIGLLVLTVFMNVMDRWTPHDGISRACIASTLGIGPWHGWLTIILQCCYTVGWVIWPVKPSPKWPIMCRVGR